MSITVDFKTIEGQKIIKELVKQSDVFIENFKTGTLKKYGLDYESLRHINNRLIYCSITGFGQVGPYSSKPGYDYVVQAISGLLSVTGEKDDLPGGGDALRNPRGGSIYRFLCNNRYLSSHLSEECVWSWPTY